MKLRLDFEFYVHLHLGEKDVSEQGNTKHLSSNLFCQAVEQEVERQRLIRSTSTIENYLTAIRSFKTFLVQMGSDSFLCHDLISQYESWLHIRLVRPNTISCYMRSLRSLTTKIYGEEYRQWFKHVYTGHAKTDKRALAAEDIAKLKHTPIRPGSSLSLTRDLFLFSFYALGMPFVDMAFLRHEQISDGQITYYRHKTGQPVTIKLEPCMQKIIDQYQDAKRPYVFPLLTSTEASTAYTEYQKALNHYNRALKTLAAKSGISHALTSYMSRHSWASIAYDKNVDLSVISKALGHTNPQHTLIYIKQINDSRLEEANHKILECIRIND